MFARIVCTMASAYWSCLIGVIERRLLEDASQLLGTARFGGWKVCKDAFQLLVSAFVHSVECAVSSEARKTSEVTARMDARAQATVLLS